MISKTVKKTKIIKIKIIALLLVFVFALQIVNAIDFYTGSIILKSLKADVDITNNANILLNYTLIGNEKVSLNFQNVPDSAEIILDGKRHPKKFDVDVNGEIFIVVKYNADVGTGAIKQFSLGPNILFNDLVNSNRINTYVVKIKMPLSVNELLSSSENPTSIDAGDGRKTFFWEKTNAYASTLDITWNSLNINLDVERIVPADINDEFEVRNVIRNNGNGVNNVKLVQSFLESDFDPVYPLNEFERIQAGNDRRLEWKKEISSIPNGGVQEISYKLKVLNRGQNVVFRPLYVYVNGVLAKIIERDEYTTKGIEPITPVKNTTSVPNSPLPAPEQNITEPTNALPVPPQAPQKIQDIAKPISPEEGKKSAKIYLPEKPSEEASTKNRTLIWAVSILIILLIVVLFAIFLNRKKDEGIKF